MRLQVNWCRSCCHSHADAAAGLYCPPDAFPGVNGSSTGTGSCSSCSWRAVARLLAESPAAAHPSVSTQDCDMEKAGCRAT